MKVLCDFHHSSLLKSLKMLFEDRLGHELYRPIGLDWWSEGFWGINDLEDTAMQFLAFDQAYRPEDGTPALNEFNPLELKEKEKDIYYVKDPGGETHHKAITLEYFKENKFDIVIASIPAHIKMFEELIRKHNPEAKLIVQMGNEWPIDYWRGHNVLASVKNRELPDDVNALFYHQEFDLNVFWWETVKPTKKIYSFINILQDMPRGWADFRHLEAALATFDFKSFGGQCRDGNMTGEREMAEKMRESEFVFHVKDHGDGFGHVIHNAYAMGRPVITRLSDYKGRLAEDLLVPGTFINLDEQDYNEVTELVRYLTETPHELAKMGDRAARRFREVVNYEKEAKEIATWLKQLK